MTKPCSTIFILLLIFILLFLNTHLVFSQESAILVEIGDEKITAKDLKDTIERLPQSVKERVKTDKGGDDFLKELVRVEVFSKEAKAVGIDKEKDFQEKLSMIIKNLLATEYIKREIIEKASVSEEEAKYYYEQNLDEYTIPERIKATQIALVFPENPSSSMISEKENLINSLLKRVKSGEDFTKLAREFSQDPFKGVSQVYTKGTLPPEIEKDVFSLAIGDISPVLKAKNIFVIFKIDGKMPEEILTFEEVKTSIMDKLRDDKRIELFEQKVQELFSKYNVVFHPQGNKELVKIDMSGKITKVIRLNEGLVNIIVKDEKGSEASITITRASKIFKRDKNGLNPSSVKNIKVGKLVEIRYSGLDAMSNSEQANAKEVIIIEENTNR